MASGWKLWVWLPCIGVVSRCCCKEVYRNFPYSTCISSFLAADPYFVHFKIVFSVLFLLFVYNIMANVTQRTFEIVQKYRDHANIIIVKLYPKLRTSNVRRRRARPSPETPFHVRGTE